MAKINTLNYQTVASWNGSQDLFIVEQPDGTKVATPAMVKQFIEAGDFVATGEVEDGHGNILKDMAKSADVDTALAGKQNTLTFDNAPTQNSNNPVKSGGIYSKIGDLTQTGLTGDSVAAQLSQLDDKISNKIKIVSATAETQGDGIGTVFYNSDIKRGKVIGVYLDNPSSTYRFCTMMVVNSVLDRFYIFAYNYNLTPIANTTVSLRVVCYE